jgi:PHD/YefM family antitoxin component YafN of YafNO toxin-antitoxin module
VPRIAPKIYRIPLVNGQVNLSRLLRRLHKSREYVVLEQEGAPVAALIDADELEDYLDIQDPKISADIRRSTQEYLAGKSRPAEEFLAELRSESSQLKKKRPKRG